MISIFTERLLMPLVAHVVRALEKVLRADRDEANLFLIDEMP